MGHIQLGQSAARFNRRDIRLWSEYEPGVRFLADNLR